MKPVCTSRPDLMLIIPTCFLSGWGIGWDENGKPYMLKFTVKEGDKTIEFPETVAYLRNGKKLVLEFKEPNTIFEIGDSVEIKK